MERSLETNDLYVQDFARLAAELDLAIALTYLQSWPKAPRNVVTLIDRHGEIRLTYAKVHTCDFSGEAACTAGEEFMVCDLDTKLGAVRIGAMICYDREFPESARILMLQGAEILIVPNACNLELQRVSQLRARAFENMMGIAVANYAAPKCNGHSIAFDAKAFDDEGRSLDNLVIEAREEEGVILARFDLEALREYRRRGTWGNAYRKPGSYDRLISLDVSEPFLRESSTHREDPADR